jgi:hypothetical protein
MPNPISGRRGAAATANDGADACEAADIKHRQPQKPATYEPPRSSPLFPPFNDCHTVVRDILDDCRQPPPSPADAGAPRR